MYIPDAGKSTFAIDDSIWVLPDPDLADILIICGSDDSDKDVWS
jgi:hypothetical protein